MNGIFYILFLLPSLQTPFCVCYSTSQFGLTFQALISHTWPAATGLDVRVLESPGVLLNSSMSKCWRFGVIWLGLESWAHRSIFFKFPSQEFFRISLLKASHRTQTGVSELNLSFWFEGCSQIGNSLLDSHPLHTVSSALTSLPTYAITPSARQADLCTLPFLKKFY